jgi:hypothetical protein
MDRITLGDGKVKENARRSAVRDACAVRAVLSYGGTDQVVSRLAFVWWLTAPSASQAGAAHRRSCSADCLGIVVKAGQATACIPAAGQIYTDRRDLVLPEQLDGICPDPGPEEPAMDQHGRDIPGLAIVHNWRLRVRMADGRGVEGCMGQS